MYCKLFYTLQDLYIQTTIVLHCSHLNINKQQSVHTLHNMCLSSLPRPKLEFCSFLCHSQAGFLGTPRLKPGQASQQSGCYPVSRPHPRSSDMLPADNELDI